MTEDVRSGPYSNATYPMLNASFVLPSDFPFRSLLLVSLKLIQLIAALLLRSGYHCPMLNFRFALPLSFPLVVAACITITEANTTHRSFAAPDRISVLTVPQHYFLDPLKEFSVRREHDAC